METTPVENLQIFKEAVQRYLGGSAFSNVDPMPDIDTPPRSDMSSTPPDDFTDLDKAIADSGL